MDIIMIGFAGQKETAQLARSRRKELLAYLPADLVDFSAAMDCRYIVPDRCETLSAQKMGRGGVREGVRLLSARLGCRIAIDYRLVPIRQETVEICGVLQLDPYDLDSEGAWLMAVRDAETALRECGWLGIPAAFVGSAVSPAHRDAADDGCQKTVRLI